MKRACATVLFVIARGLITVALYLVDADTKKMKSLHPDISRHIDEHLESLI